MGKCKTKPIQKNLGTFRHNQAYSKPCVNLAYSESWYIQNTNIFKPEPYSERWYIHNPGVLKILEYSKPKAYLEICDVKHLP